MICLPKLIRAGLGLVALLHVWARPALAAPDAPEEARRHYQRALELVDEGAYAEAAVEFSRAYELAPRHTVLYNLAQAYVALGKPVAAIDTFRRYLAEGGMEIPPARRAQVEEEIHRQEARVATLTVTTDPVGATVHVDSVAVGKSPLPAPVRVGIGDHQVAATLDGHTRAELTVTLAGEENKLVMLRLETLPPVERVQLVAAQAPPAPADAGRRRKWGYVTGAVGLAAGAAAAGLYVWNRDRFDSWNATDLNLYNNPTQPDYQQRKAANDDLAGSIRRVNTVTGALAVGAGLLLATGIVLAW